MSLKEAVSEIADDLENSAKVFAPPSSAVMIQCVKALRYAVKAVSEEVTDTPSTEGPGRHHGVAEARGGPLSGEMVAFDFQGPNYTGTLAGHLYAYSTRDYKLHWLGSDLPAPKPDTIVQEGHSES